jgi:hypothetical protein
MICDQRLHRLVLLRAKARLQQNCRSALPDAIEARQLATSTINVRLAAVRRLAYEAADSGLLSPELAASICRVKGPKKLGVRLGNWLTAQQGKALLSIPVGSSVRGKRDYAMLSLLLQQNWLDLGSRHHRKSRLVHGARVCRQGQDRKVGAA